MFRVPPESHFSMQGIGGRGNRREECRRCGRGVRKGEMETEEIEWSSCVLHYVCVEQALLSVYRGETSESPVCVGDAKTLHEHGPGHEMYWTAIITAMCLLLV
jgi:hypothetical protein